MQQRILGVGLTVAAAAVNAWVLWVAAGRPHVVTGAVAALILVASVAAVVAMWLDLSRNRAGAAPAAAPHRCPRCGQAVAQRAPARMLSRALARVGVVAYACTLCGRRSIGRARGPASDAASDQRRHRRLSARFPVRYLDGDGIADAVVTEISVGGCQLETSAPLVAGAGLVLELGAPEQGNVLAVEATVVRTVGPGAFALRFAPPVERRDRDRLRWIVQRLLAAGPPAAPEPAGPRG
ncbi:MAG: PilZ domain-containing protein [Candidatus Rokubacteria bacterium]|nr:PilZ domain-containing protein [Candidatus Rokubacteria bacterium]